MKIETTIGISKRLRNQLNGLKIHNNQSYNDVIWYLLECYKKYHKKIGAKAEV